jgi:hypothetical protein
VSATLFGWIGEFENAIPYSGSGGQHTAPYSPQARCLVASEKGGREGRKKTYIENRNTVQAPTSWPRSRLGS